MERRVLGSLLNYLDFGVPLVVVVVVVMVGLGISGIVDLGQVEIDLG